MWPPPSQVRLALLLLAGALAGPDARAEGMPTGAPAAPVAPILRADPGASPGGITQALPGAARLSNTVSGLTHLADPAPGPARLMDPPPGPARLMEPPPGPTRMANPVAVTEAGTSAVPAAATRAEMNPAASGPTVSAGDSPVDTSTPAPRSGLAAAWAMVASALVGGLTLGGLSGGATLLGGLALLLAAWLLRRFLLGSPLPTPVVRTEPTGWGSAPPPQDDPVPPIAHSARNGAALRLPPGFDLPGFLREARLSFVRLQAANDHADVDDLREFTTPQMYAALAHQIEARQGLHQAVEVTALDAQLLDLAVLQDEALASVRFHGSAREGQSIPLPFTEVWHVRKSLSDPRSAWLLDGIQQST